MKWDFSKIIWLVHFITLNSRAYCPFLWNCTLRIKWQRALCVTSVKYWERIGLGHHKSNVPVIFLKIFLSLLCDLKWKKHCLVLMFHIFHCLWAISLYKWNLSRQKSVDSSNIVSSIKLELYLSGYRCILERVIALLSSLAGSYPSPKAGATLVMHKDLLVLFGGWTRPSPYPLHQPERFFDEIHTYSPSKNWWERLQELKDLVLTSDEQVETQYSLTFNYYLLFLS